MDDKVKAAPLPQFDVCRPLPAAFPPVAAVFAVMRLFSRPTRRMAFYECGLRALHYFLAPFRPRPLTTSVSFRMVRTGKDTQGPPLLCVT